MFKVFSFLWSLLAVFVSLFVQAKTAAAAYTPLIVASDFDGIRSDASTAILGVLSVVLIVVAGVVIVRILSR